MTNLDTLKALSERATAGEWQVNGVRGKIIAADIKQKLVYHGIGPDGTEVAAVWFDERTGLGFEDAKFLVAAVNFVRNDLPSLLKDNERLRIDAVDARECARASTEALAEAEADNERLRKAIDHIRAAAKRVTSSAMSAEWVAGKCDVALNESNPHDQ